MCCDVQGPTLTMQIHEYSLMKDVTATLLRPRQPDSMWKAPPLVVMNNFAGLPGPQRAPRKNFLFCPQKHSWQRALIYES